MLCGCQQARPGPRLPAAGCPNGGIVQAAGIRPHAGDPGATSIAGAPRGAEQAGASQATCATCLELARRGSFALWYEAGALTCSRLVRDTSRRACASSSPTRCSSACACCSALRVATTCSASGPSQESPPQLEARSGLEEKDRLSVRIESRARVRFRVSTGIRATAPLKPLFCITHPCCACRGTSCGTPGRRRGASINPAPAVGVTRRREVATGSTPE